MFGWFKRKFAKRDVLNVEIVGASFEINPNPEATGPKRRHLARIIRLAHAASVETDAKRIKAMRQEVADRKAALARVGVAVPNTLPECEKLLQEMTDG